MKIALLTIGDELLNGDLADTNTAEIARQLFADGFRLHLSVSTGDQLADIATMLKHLVAEHDAVIVTGGLGPTEDDRTARAAARAFDRPLALHDTALDQIRARFRQWQRAMHPANEKQAMLPSRSTVIANPEGTAPGFHLRQNNTDLYFLPGVPREMRIMLETEVIPALRNRFPDRPPLCQRTITLFGLPEPEVESRLQNCLPEQVALALNVDFPMVQVKLRTSGTDAQKNVDRAEVVVRKVLGDFIVGFDKTTLAETVGRQLTAAGRTLALAESCTGGLISKLLTDLPGASTYLERGIVSYANTAKIDCLGVDPEILERYGAVSDVCALAMARGVRMRARTDIGLAVTGIAGPEGGTADKPVGTVYIALSGPDGEHAERFQFPGDRDRVRLRTACMALEWLRRATTPDLSGDAS
jgi:nicotinamide-nucleotide amidase